MCLTDFLTIIALVLNFAALIVVMIQTILTRKALDTARTSIESSRKTRELEDLPRASLIIIVQNDLLKWKKELQDAISSLRIISQSQDSNELRTLGHRGLKSPKGLIIKYRYEHCPNWLSVIWVTGAQYYYNAKAPQCDLWNDRTNQPNFNFVEMMISLYQKSIEGLTDLLAYIDDIVPKAYLESPASLNDESFLTD
jgi:hypothetical protein